MVRCGPLYVPYTRNLFLYGILRGRSTMTEEQILEILDLRGLDTILEEHHMSLPFVLGLLHDLGYLDLERYIDSEEEL